METEMEKLAFVTIDRLLAYGESMSRRIAGEGIELPPAPPYGLVLGRDSLHHGAGRAD
jgi:hypothetical protein